MCLKIDRVCPFDMLKRCTKFNKHWWKGVLLSLPINLKEHACTYMCTSDAISSLQQVPRAEDNKCCEVCKSK